MTTDTKDSSDEKPTRKLYKEWFDKSAATDMASQIAGAYEEFDKATFKRLALHRIDTLEFSGRVKQFASALHHTLPKHYPKAIKIITKSFPEQSVNAESVTDGWLQWPIGQFIADYGTDHFNDSMKAMVLLTQQFSSEFAVRPFVVRYPEETLNELLKLTNHPSEHVRRWCSEGTRTRLPWGIKLNGLIENPAPIWRILRRLIDDESLYVRRSVANSINDLSKDHPDQVIKQCAYWRTRKSPHRDWIIKHGLRGLIKAGYSDALDLIGYSTPIKIAVELTARPKVAKIGETVQLAAMLSNNSKSPQRLIVDYVVHYVRLNGANKEKVFKWKAIELQAGERINLAKKHSLKHTSVRALHKGVHKVDVQINGHRLANANFKLH